MEKAIFKKEWLKTRMAAAVSLILCMSMAIYAILKINRLVALKGADHLWMIMLLKDNTFIDAIQYTTIISALIIGIAQMAPEMAQKRLKLTLHLPYPQTRMILLMLGVGLVELFVIYALQCVSIAVFYSKIIPASLVWRVVLTSLPWYFAGFIAYLFTAAVCLEGTWLRRAVLALLGICAVMICYLQPAPEAYNGMMWLIIVFAFVLALLPLGSVLRFKEGRQ
ncbi:MAG: hypothetical protein NC102_05120 [Clostridium sp.]|nr:hypothetical protein [Clostridium sp.]